MIRESGHHAISLRLLEIWPERWICCFCALEQMREIRPATCCFCRKFGSDSLDGVNAEVKLDRH